MAIAALVAVVLIGAAFAWRWPSQNTTYVFSPCPGLTVTSTATTGIWNCPNIAAFTAGENVTLTGTWELGYATLGCVPISNESSCMVPQIAILTHYLHVDTVDSWFVVQLKQNTTVQPNDGQVVTVSGVLQAITYPSSPGATYPIYHLNNQADSAEVLQPQPSFEITNPILD